MTLFSRLALAGSLIVAAVFLNGCSLFHWGADDEGDPDYFWPTIGDPGTNSQVAKFVVGDTVTISLQGIPDPPTPHVEPIKDDGTISMPEIGHVVAKDKTPGELQNEIHDLYVPKYYNQVTVNVSSGERVYYVTGEVKQPGRVLYTGETTVSKAITTAGDFSEFSNRHKIYLIRGNHKLRVDYYHIFEHPEDDPLVYPGDTIKVIRRFS